MMGNIDNLTFAENFANCFDHMQMNKKYNSEWIQICINISHLDSERKIFSHYDFIADG